MMYLLLIFSFLINSHQATNDDDFEKYEKAYNYIVNDSIYVQNSFKNYFENPIKNICVSQEIIKYSYIPFDDEIVLFYQDYYSIDFDSAKLLFQIVESSKSKEEIKFNNYFDKTPCELMIFFSRIKQNQFRAEVEIFCEECKSYSTYGLIPMPKLISYYFIFEDENIVKVFKEIGYR